MANKLSKTGIVSLATIRPWHVSQSVDALAGLNDYDITISGSLTVTGSVYINSLYTASNVDVVTIDPLTGQLFSTASNSFNSTTNITNNVTNSISNYYTSSITNSYTSSTVVNNYTSSTTTNNLYTSSIFNNYTSSTIINSYTSSTVNNYTSSITNSYADPAPSDQYIQYNSSSAFGASSGFQYVYTSESLQQGANVNAIGVYSHAEGKSTISVGTYSHAEGDQTTSAGNYSHAEGFRNSSAGDYSHAEGIVTRTLGYASHTEGKNTISVGDHSHAEGEMTLTEGTGSHAEGYFTSASGDYQHVSGMYNIPSTNPGAFIIGNGNSTTRSNILYASGSKFQTSASLNLSGSFVPQYRYLGSVQVAGANPGIQTYPSDYNITFQASTVGLGNKNEILLPNNPQTGSIIYLQRISGTAACKISGSGTHTINGAAGYTFPTGLFARRMFVFWGSGWYTEPNPIV